MTSKKRKNKSRGVMPEETKQKLRDAYKSRLAAKVKEEKAAKKHKTPERVGDIRDQLAEYLGLPT